jgi:hypothetical protein
MTAPKQSACMFSYPFLEDRSFGEDGNLGLLSWPSREAAKFDVRTQSEDNRCFLKLELHTPCTAQDRIKLGHSLINYSFHIFPCY